MQSDTKHTDVDLLDGIRALHGWALLATRDADTDDERRQYALQH